MISTRGTVSLDTTKLLLELQPISELHISNVFDLKMVVWSKRV